MTKEEEIFDNLKPLTMNWGDTQMVEKRMVLIAMKEYGRRN